MSVTGELSLDLERSQGDIANSNLLARPPSFSQFGNSNFMDSEVSMDRSSPANQPSYSPKNPTQGPTPPQNQSARAEEAKGKQGAKNYESNDSFHFEIRNHSSPLYSTTNLKGEAGGMTTENHEMDSNDHFNEFEMTFEIPDLKEDSIAEVNQLKDLTSKLLVDEKSLNERNNLEDDFQSKISEMFVPLSAKWSSSFNFFYSMKTEWVHSAREISPRQKRQFRRKELEADWEQCHFANDDRPMQRRDQRASQKQQNSGRRTLSSQKRKRSPFGQSERDKRVQKERVPRERNTQKEHHLFGKR